MKRSIIRFFVLAALTIVAGHEAQAQLRWGFYINGVAPVGSFASDVNNGGNIPLMLDNMGKQASVGFGGGARAYYRFDVGVGEVAPFVNLDLFWNSLSGGLNAAYADSYNGVAPTYFNFPLLVGATYFYDELWNDIALYGEFGVGPDLMVITGEKDGAGNSYKYKNTTAMGMMVGAGAFFGRHFSAGLYYYSLGTHNIDYTSRTLRKNEIANANYELHVATNMPRERRYVGEVALRIGFHF